jgi:hypothetical protein
MLRFSRTERSFLEPERLAGKEDLNASQFGTVEPCPPASRLIWLGVDLSANYVQGERPPSSAGFCFWEGSKNPAETSLLGGFVSQRLSAWSPMALNTLTPRWCSGAR